MEIPVSEVKQQLDSHEKHCDERHQTFNTTLARLSADVIRLASDVDNIKTNIAELKQDMRSLRSDVDNRIEALRSEINALRNDVDNRIEALRSEIRWMMGASVGFISLLIIASTYIGQLPA